MGRLIYMAWALLIVYSLAEQGMFRFITVSEKTPHDVQSKFAQFVGDAIYCGRGTGLRQYASSCRDCPKKYMGYSVKTTCGGNCRYNERLGQCVRKGIP